MSTVVNTNLSSLRAQNDLGGITGSLIKSTQKLASGVRVNSAADDAASLSLSKKLSAQISSSKAAKDNTKTAINMIQTADSDLAIVQNHVQRMRDLSVQAANGVYSAAERSMLNDEYQNLYQEAMRTYRSSKFADINLFDLWSMPADGTDIDFQVGTNATNNDVITHNFPQMDYEMSTKLGGNISTQANAQWKIESIDLALGVLNTYRSSMGAAANRLQGSVARIDTRKENLANANSTITDTDYGSEMAGYTKKQILQQTTTSMLQQANQEPAMALQLLR
ncbi:MAG: flagellin [Candidatus Gastranaerophilales bacterium]|nr:flagellin [Candidatus Gastranaerophilales bacterium]